MPEKKIPIQKEGCNKNVQMLSNEISVSAGNVMRRRNAMPVVAKIPVIIKRRIFVTAPPEFLRPHAMLFEWRTSLASSVSGFRN